MASQLISHSPRDGTTLFEVVVAVTLLAAGLAMTGQVLYSTSLVRRENERRQCALQEAANALERLRGLPWSELAAEAPPQLALSDVAAERLPQARLSIQIRDEVNAPAAKHLVVAVAWQLRNGQPASPVQLSSWRYAPERQP